MERLQENYDIFIKDFFVEKNMHTLLNLLIGIWGGLVSSVIVSKVFMLIQDYYSKYGDIKKYILILYRIQIYLKVVSSRLSKTITYENNQNCPIGKEDKDVFRIEKLVDDIYPEILYSKYKEKELESTRNSTRFIQNKSCNILTLLSKIGRNDIVQDRKFQRNKYT